MPGRASEPLPPTHPVLVLPETVLFPRVVLPLLLFEERELALVEELLGPDGLPRKGGHPRLVLSLCQWDSNYPQEARPNPIGTLAEVIEASPDGPERTLLVRGLGRVQIAEALRSDPYCVARVEPAGGAGWSQPRGGSTLREQTAALRQRAQALAFAKETPRAQELLNVIEWIDDPGTLSDYIAHQLVSDWYLKQELLEMVDPAERVHMLLDVLEAPEGAKPGA